MKKPNNLLNLITNIFMIIINFIRYFSLGLFFSSYILINSILTPAIKTVSYAIKGFIITCFMNYKILDYARKGIMLPFILGYKFLNTYKIEREKKLKAKRELEAKQRIIYEQQKAREELERKVRLAKEKELARLEREKIMAERKSRHKKENDIYVNENAKIEKKSLGDHINDILIKIVSVPKKMVNKFKSKINNSIIAKNSRNNKKLQRESLLIDFAGKDAEKSETKLLYEYTAKRPDGKITKGYFEAYSKVEVHSFLLSEGMEVYTIRTNKWIRFLYAQSGTSATKVKNKDLVFFLTQLSTYIKAGIPLVESLKILTRQYKNKAYQRIFRSMIYDLTMGENFSTAMEKQSKSFPRLLVNMIKTSEMTGELPEVLDDMAEYYTETEKTRKAMISALMYPMIILVIAVIVVTFIMIFVIPQFVEIFENINSGEIPGITLMIMGLSEFLQNYWWLCLIVIAVVIFVCIYLYKNVTLIRIFTQWILMHTPVIGNVIIYNEVTMFTKTFASLLEHNVFITDSMEILNRITNNEIYKTIIKDTIVNLAQGEKISAAFKNHWAFPVPAYEMLVTGEKTGELPQMMKKVSEYYQDLHKNAVTRIKTFIEPILIIFLTVIVGVIVLSIIIPMFSVYDSLDAEGL